MRITSIELENIRCFEHIVVDLCQAGSASPWSVILGDNGVGKSTLLRSITLGLSSPKIAGALLEDAGTPWLRRGARRGTISLNFDDGNKCELRIKLQSYGEKIVDHKASSGATWWDKIFVCGYGAARSFFGDTSYSQYSVRDAVSTLFNYDSRLQNPELMLRRLVSPTADSPSTAGKEVLRQIDQVLMLPPGSTRLEKTGLEIRGPWGNYTPVGALGDGYKATLAWILDLIGWAMFRDPQMLESGIEGIVLVDEIEQHLHPQWQRRILKILHDQFPRIQFISTTHSPLCVIGTTDFSDQEISLIHLQQIDDSVQASSNLKPPRGLRADQVLTSYLFGLETTGDNQTTFEIERLSRLLSQSKPTAEEEKEVAHLRKTLSLKLGSAETELERQVSDAVLEALETNLRKSAAKMKTGDLSQGVSSLSPNAAYDLEVKRQLKDLLG